MNKAMITGDYHAQYLDEVAFVKMLSFAKKYKPNIFVINGDLVDYYSISKFDKNPNRKTTLYEEILIARKILKTIRKTVGNKCKIYWLQGNHEIRLINYLRSHNEILSFPFFGTDRLFELDKHNVKLITASADYDKDVSEIGHLKISNMFIMHGDNRLNGATTSRYSGYSASNTVRNLMCNVILGHSHRAGKIYHTTPYSSFVGMESGCLCKTLGTANWQQGFITFEFDNKTSYNHRVILISDL